MIDLNELKKSKVFCIAPWIHLYALPSGDVFPCCLNDTKLGNLNNDKISDLINSPLIKKLRSEMISETKPEPCYKCLDQPLNDWTHRNYLNNRYLDKHFDLVKQTSKNGEVKDFKFVYWDFRFSNYCNMKCRMCGPEYSTKWYEDIEEKLQIQKIANDFDIFLEEIDPYIKDIDKIFMAGGESIIMPEHWKFLDKLINENRCNDILLQYQTNLSKLTFKDRHVFDIWKKFKNINICASLDGSHKLAEYIRYGTNWKKIEENIFAIQKELSNVTLSVSITVNLMNIHTLVNFCKYLIDIDIHPNEIAFNVLFYPSFYSINVLPQELKEKYTNEIEEYIFSLDNQILINGFRNVLDRMNSNDKFDLEFKNFCHYSNELDKKRKETTLEILPHYEKYWKIT
tara:strand:+ start:25 stop:1218 length:1194 start_codon:yes stop_codon:yes gene_type:complete